MIVQLLARGCPLRINRLSKSLRQLELGERRGRPLFHFNNTLSHSANSGGAASFEHVARMLSLQRFNQNYSNLLVFSYTTVYAVVRTDGKGS